MSTESAPRAVHCRSGRPAGPNHGPSGSGVALYALAISPSPRWSARCCWQQRVTNMQEQLARQSADSGTQAVEARTIAQQAQDVA